MIAGTLTLPGAVSKCMYLASIIDAVFPDGNVEASEKERFSHGCHRY